MWRLQGDELTGELGRRRAGEIAMRRFSAKLTKTRIAVI
jgi:hypothetical protein